MMHCCLFLHTMLEILAVKMWYDEYDMIPTFSNMILDWTLGGTKTQLCLRNSPGMHLSNHNEDCVNLLLIFFFFYSSNQSTQRAWSWIWMRLNIALRGIVTLCSTVICLNRIKTTCQDVLLEQEAGVCLIFPWFPGGWAGRGGSLGVVGSPRLRASSVVHDIRGVEGRAAGQKQACGSVMESVRRQQKASQAAFACCRCVFVSPCGPASKKTHVTPMGGTQTGLHKHTQGLFVIVTSLFHIDRTQEMHPAPEFKRRKESAERKRNINSMTYAYIEFKGHFEGVCAT